MSSNINPMLKHTGAGLFLEAKIKEFEAACYYGDQKRIAACEDDCRNALQSMLDAKLAMVKKFIMDAKDRNQGP